ncbi:MAG: hypothetical protein L3J94_07385 [Gammaproteobacteria bacterium]|nr:hypothetical protein [Gammaproteobacteria bacterium]
MQKSIRYFLMLMALLLPWSAQSAPLTLIYSGDFNGELEPCGCSEGGNYGGVLRRSTTLKALREEQPDLVAISAGQLLANESRRDQLKSEYILKAFSTLHYDAVAVRWRDLAYGTAFIESYNIPWLVGNWQHPDDNVTTSRKITRDGVTLRVFSWLSPKRSPFRQMDESQWLTLDDVSVVQQGLKEASERGELTVLLTAWPLRKVKREFNLADVDILVVRAAHEIFSEPQLEGDTLVLQPGSRGMRLGRVDLEFTDGKIKEYQHQVIEMPESVADDESLRQWYIEYNAKVKAAYLAEVEVKKRLASGERDYLGVDTCATCHQPQFEAWQGMKHADAFATLENVGKSFDPDCIVCHTVGFDAGGFIDFTITPELMNVQCESCHGAGKAHVESRGEIATPNQAMPPQARCQQCHVGSHSPDFSYDRYWPKVVH